ncbi:uncharacterized protein LOC132509374 isoform X5 [Lagenorhynchus albirostris]|uniref:uncharacterized protein LOC132509374 isoform X5 n=1 Tax=Lagenorhynchus albirostris TaxID=27610 RepID=UPI0028E8EC8F|nr:uncharacterized protein LOC132509374 isoform X5 [Lagenorhynchus albirostris]
MTIVHEFRLCRPPPKTPLLPDSDGGGRAEGPASDSHDYRSAYGLYKVCLHGTEKKETRSGQNVSLEVLSQVRTPKESSDLLPSTIN